MLQITKDLGPKQQKYLITGDENWIFWDNNHLGMWVQDREDIPANAKKMISSKDNVIGVFLVHWLRFH
jgi:hypothetical protein